jgi:4'-phosphopantetheinyl transferase
VSGPTRPVEVDVWWFEAGAAGPGIEDLLRTLDAREAARLDRLPDATMRRASAAAAYLLRCAVATRSRGEVAGVRVERDCPDCDQWHGRPRIVRPRGYQVSASHAGARVCVAVTVDPRARAVGVDVESVAAFAAAVNADPGIGAAVLSPAELAASVAVPSASALGRYWVRKEAVLKALGDGLRREMTTLTVSAPHQPPALVAAQPALAASLSLADLLGGGSTHLGAVAVLGAGSNDLVVRERDGAELLGGGAAMGQPPS